MKLINYAQKYETEVIDLWNACCTFDPIDKWKFRNQLILDENFDPSMAWIALDGSRIIGFICSTVRKFPYGERGLEKGKGWINVIFTDPQYRRKGVGSSLYKQSEAQLQAKGVSEIILGAYSPDYFFAGLDPDHYPESVCFFEKHGFYSGKIHYSMGRNLHGYQLSTGIKKQKEKMEQMGYSFSMFTYEDSIELLEFIGRELSPGWKRNSLISQRNRSAEDTQIIVRNPKGIICGWCMRAMDGNPMRFGPIGISSEERNHELGSVLLALQCFEMSKRGIYRMYFVTTDEAGKRFYEKNGLQIIRRYVDYRKILSDEDNKQHPSYSD